MLCSRLRQTGKGLNECLNLYRLFVVVVVVNVANYITIVYPLLKSKEHLIASIGYCTHMGIYSFGKLARACECQCAGRSIAWFGPIEDSRGNMKVYNN